VFSDHLAVDAELFPAGYAVGTAAAGNQVMDGDSGAHTYAGAGKNRGRPRIGTGGLVTGTLRPGARAQRLQRTGHLVAQRQG
jgi:hypothetical protein